MRLRLLIFVILLVLMLMVFGQGVDSLSSGNNLVVQQWKFSAAIITFIISFVFILCLDEYLARKHIAKMQKCLRRIKEKHQDKIERIEIKIMRAPSAKRCALALFIILIMGISLFFSFSYPLEGLANASIREIVAILVLIILLTLILMVLNLNCAHKDHTDTQKSLDEFIFKRRITALDVTTIAVIIVLMAITAYFIFVSPPTEPANTSIKETLLILIGALTAVCSCWLLRVVNNINIKILRIEFETSVSGFISVIHYTEL